MSGTSGEATMVGYVAGTMVGYGDGTTTWTGPWHTNPACPELHEPEYAEATPTALDACELGRAQRELDRDPCWECAYEPILDELGAVAGRRGEGNYHALICDDRHLNEVPCWLCDVLTRYARSRGTLTAKRGGHVALLRPGALSYDEVEATIGRDLDGHSTHDGALPDVNENTWQVAAELIRGKTTLTGALQAAGALLSPPASTKRQVP